MKLAVVIILVILLGAVFIQGYLIFKERNQLKAEVLGVNDRLEALTKENNDLRLEIDYFSHPENLEKELRSKLNYKKPDEKMIIVVP